MRLDIVLKIVNNIHEYKHNFTYLNRVLKNLKTGKLKKCYIYIHSYKLQLFNCSE